MTDEHHEPEVGRQLDELEARVREQGWVPAFLWPEEGEHVEACMLRMKWGERGDGTMLIQFHATDGSWTQSYLVRGSHFEAAVREASGGLDDSDEPVDQREH